MTTEEFQAWTDRPAVNPHLMLIAQVSLQVTQLRAAEVTKQTLVGLDVIVLHHVQTQAFRTAARESAFVAAEDDALEVA